MRPATLDCKSQFDCLIHCVLGMVMAVAGTSGCLADAPAEPDAVEAPVVHLYPAPSGGKWGYINQLGEFVIPPTYKRTYMFDEGLGAVIDANGASFIRPDGTVAIQGEFQWAYGFWEGLGLVQSSQTGKWGFIDKRGNWVVEPAFDQLYEFSGGLAAARRRRDEPMGYIDKSGNWRIPPDFPHATRFSDGLAVVHFKDGGLGLIAPDGTPRLRFKAGWATPISEGLVCASIGPEARFGAIRPDGTLQIPATFEGLTWFTEGLAAAKSEDKWGYIDHSGKWVIKPRFLWADVFEQGMAMVELEGGLAYIDKRGRIVWREPHLENAEAESQP